MYLLGYIALQTLYLGFMFINWHAAALLKVER